MYLGVRDKSQDSSWLSQVFCEFKISEIVDLKRLVHGSYRCYLLSMEVIDLIFFFDLTMKIGLWTCISSQYLFSIVFFKGGGAPNAPRAIHKFRPPAFKGLTQVKNISVVLLFYCASFFIRIWDKTFVEFMTYGQICKQTTSD